jgi:hypothetical protein
MAKIIENLVSDFCYGDLKNLVYVVGSSLTARRELIRVVGAAFLFIFLKERPTEFWSGFVIFSKC